MSLSLDNVISVTVNPPVDVVSSADFGTVVIFSPDIFVPQLDTRAYLEYSTLTAFQQDFPQASTPDSLTQTVEYFFSQTKRPAKLYLAPWNVEEGQRLADAYATLSAKWDGWYCAIPVGHVAEPDELLEAAQWIQAASKIQAISDGAACDTTPSTSTLKPLIDAELYRTLVLWSSKLTDAGSSPVISVAALLCSINFEAANSMLTLKFKDLPGVTTDDAVTDSIADALTQQGINYFTTFGTKRMLAEGWMLGATLWADEVIGLDWLRSELQTSVFNGMATLDRIPLSDQGVATVMNYVDTAMRKALRNGLIGPGIWDGNAVGALNTGDYLENGYYIYADSVSTLSEDDRKNRKCPPITVCAHIAGAIHSVVINVNTSR